MKKIALLLVVVLLLTGCGAQNEPKQDPKSTPSETAAASPEPTADGINMEDIAKALVTDLSQGNYEEAVKEYPYDDTMSKLINEAFYKDQFWGFFTTSFGAYKEITGTLSQEQQGYTIIGVRTAFEKASVIINVVFDGNGKLAGLNYVMDKEAQTNAPEGVIETEITFGESGWELPGTLATPKDGDKFPVVILVHGSGPNDRDETIGPNKPFRDIAWELAKKGIATLRYDKRSLVYGQKMAAISSITVNEETVNDAALAVEFLKNHERIDAERIFILGHSLGGMMMPRIAQKTPDASGYIILAGPVTSLHELMAQQVQYMSELDGTLTDAEKKQIENYKIMRDNVNKLASDSDIPAGQLFGIPAPYWLDLKAYNPAEAAKSIEKPLFIMQGERDYQVTMDEFMLWKDALSHKKNVTFKSYEGLNHILMYGTEKSSPDEYYKLGKVDLKIIDDISSWVKQ